MILYKYCSFGRPGIFMNSAIRITQPKYLNNVFESIPFLIDENIIHDIE